MAKSSMPGLMEFYASSSVRRLRAVALAIAALAAGTLSTLVQVLLWRLFTDAWPGILFRDARLVAAIVLGRSVLPPPASFDLGVMAVATVVHFVLSFVYTALLALLLPRRSTGRAAVAGLLFGILLYAVNMHAFTMIFPWFEQARDWIALVAHAVFGLVAAIAYRATAPRPDA